MPPLKKLIAIAVFVSLLVMAGCAQGQASLASRASAEGASSAEEASAPGVSSVSAGSGGTGENSNAASESARVLIDVNGTQLTMLPSKTEAAHALVEQLRGGPVKVSLHAYGGFEQVGSLPWSLPASDEQVTTSPGDVMLYQGNQITIFTGSNSWAYTSLGHIEGATAETLQEVFGGGAVDVTLSLA